MKIQAIRAFLVIAAFACAPPLLAEKAPENQVPPPECSTTLAGCPPGAGQATCVNPSCGVWVVNYDTLVLTCSYVAGQAGGCVCLADGPYGSCTNK